jgi:hypothetical protein
MDSRREHTNHEARMMTDKDKIIEVDPRHVEFNRWFNVLFPDQTPELRFKLVGAVLTTWNAALSAAANRFHTMAQEEGYDKTLTPDQVADLIERIKVSEYVNVN